MKWTIFCSQPQWLIRLHHSYSSTYYNNNNFDPWLGATRLVSRIYVQGRLKPEHLPNFCFAFVVIWTDNQTKTQLGSGGKLVTNTSYIHAKHNIYNMYNNSLLWDYPTNLILRSSPFESWNARCFALRYWETIFQSAPTGFPKLDICFILIIVYCLKSPVFYTIAILFISSLCLLIPLSFKYISVHFW